MPQLFSLVGKALGNILRPSSSGGLGRRCRSDSLDSTDETQQQPWSKAQSATASEPQAECRPEHTSVRFSLEPVRSSDSAPSLHANPIVSEAAAEGATGRLNDAAACAGNTSDTGGTDGGSPSSKISTFFSRASLSDTASAAGEALRQASMTNRKDEFTRDNLVAYMRWVRASRGAIKLAGKVGPAKEVAAQAKRVFRKGPYRGPSPALLLRCEHWLEVTDEQHRYGSNLRVYFDYWVAEMEAAELTPPPSPAIMSPSPSHTQLTALVQQTQSQTQLQLQPQPLTQHQPQPLLPGGGVASDGAPTLSGQDHIPEVSCQSRSQSRRSSHEQQPAERQRNTAPYTTPLQLQQVQQDSMGPLLATWQSTSDGSLGCTGPRPSRFSADAALPAMRVSETTELQQQSQQQQHPHTHAHAHGHPHPRAHQPQHPQHHLTRMKHKHLHWSYQMHNTSEPGSVQGPGCQGEKLSQADQLLCEREGSVCQVAEDGAGEPTSNRGSCDGEDGGAEAGPLRTGSLTLSPAFTHSETGSCETANGRKGHDMDPGQLSSNTASAGTQLPEQRGWRGETESDRRRSCGEVPLPQSRDATVQPRPNSASLPALDITPAPLPSKVPAAGSSPRRNSLCSPSRRFALAALVDMSSESQPKDQLEQQGQQQDQLHGGRTEAAGTLSPAQGSVRTTGVTQVAGSCGDVGGEELIGSLKDRPPPETPPPLPRVPYLGADQVESDAHDDAQTQPQHVPAPGRYAVADVANMLTPSGGVGAFLSSSYTAQRAVKLMAQREGVGNGSSFFRWLDYGAGLEVDLADRGVPRAKLDSERVKYLTPVELLEYELDVDMDTGLLRYKRSGKLLHTGPDGRGSVDEHRRPPTPPPPAVPLSFLGDGAAAWWRCSAVDHTSPVATPSNSSAAAAAATSAPHQLAGASPRGPAPVGMFGARDSGGGAGAGAGLPSHPASRCQATEPAAGGGAVLSRKAPAPAAALEGAPVDGPRLDIGCVRAAAGSRGPTVGPLEAAVASGFTASAKAGGGVGGVSGSNGGGGSVLLDLEVRGHSASSLNRWERPQAECDSPLDSAGSSNGNSRRHSATNGDGGDGVGGSAVATRLTAGGTISGVIKLAPDEMTSFDTVTEAAAGGSSGLPPGSARSCALGFTASMGQGVVQQEGGSSRTEAAVLSSHLHLLAPPSGLPVLQVAPAVGPIAAAAGGAATSPSVPTAAPVPVSTPVGVKASGSGYQPEEREKVAKWIYVVDPELRLFVHPKVRGRFHHSSFLRGGAVVAAGGLAARHGRLQMLTADSGHYWPREENFRWLCEHLVSAGADLSFCELRSKHMSVPAATGRELMEKMGVPPPPWRLPSQLTVALETLTEGSGLQEPQEMGEGGLQRD